VISFSHIEPGRGYAYTSREALKVDFKRIKGTAKSFAVFGSLFQIFECMLDKTRKRSDIWNSYYGGMFTTMFLAMDSGMRVRGLMMTGITGGLFGVLMEKVMGGFHK